MNKSKFSFFIVLFLILFSCKKEDDTGNPIVKEVATIIVSPNSTSFSALGETAQLTAESKDKDGFAITGKTFIWASSDNNVATVINGLVTAVSIGNATISATVDGIKGTAQITVLQTATEITIAPTDHIFATIGETFSFTAEVKDGGGNLIDMAQVTWESSDMNIVGIDNNGLATATGQGDAIITASTNGLDAMANVSVKLIVADLELNPLEIDLEIDGATTLSATATDPSGVTIINPELTWSSLNESIATVDENGKVSGIAAGSTFIRVSSNGINANTKVNVLPPIDLTGIWKGNGSQNGVDFEVELTIIDEGNGMLTSQNGFTNSVKVICSIAAITHFGFEVVGNYSGNDITIEDTTDDFNFTGSIISEVKLLGKFTTTVPLGLCDAIFTDVNIFLNKQ